MDLLILGTFIKLLLFPAYRSTDFDVHRNWLAITHNLPLKEWYFEHTSQWTLDYPPFFAYFEYFLTFFVPEKAIKDGCFDINEQDFLYGFNTVVFQRLSVIVTELVLALVLSRLNSKPIFAVVWMCPCWLVLDHIHFQYNGFLFGLFLLSVVLMVKRRVLLSALAFSTVLCFKHIYLYVAPAYFLHLLKFYVAPHKNGIERGVFNLAKLGIVTLIPPALAFLPIWAVSGVEGLQQVITRLFPFSRGLTHAYWAPNAWAVYSALDRVLGIVNKNSVESATRGIVGQVAFSNLREITPSLTFAITAGLQFVFAISGTEGMFVENVTLCGFAAFLFGWHVHEKAVLTVLVPFALVCVRSKAHLRAFIPLLVSGCFSLLPLLWTPAESVIKYTYTVTYLLIVMKLLPKEVQSTSGWLNWLYLIGYAAVVPFCELVPLLVPKFEYAGLMLVSLYSFGGVFLSFVQLSFLYFRASLSGSKPVEHTPVKPTPAKSMPVKH